MSTADNPLPFDTLLVVPQFHYDVAYLQRAETYFPRCWDNLREAIRLMDSDPAYRYTVEQPFLLEVFAERCPDDWQRLKACHGRGQLEVSGALYVIPDMNFPSGECLLRQVLWGKRWAQDNLSVDVRAAWIADAWGHPPSLPQILKHAGVDAYFFTRAMEPGFGKGDFRWRGFDGTTLPVHWLPRTYAALSFPKGAVDNAAELAQVEASEANLRALADDLRGSCALGIALIPTGGDMAFPSAEALPTMRSWQARHLPVRFGTVAEYARALADAEPDLPEYAGEFNPLFTGTQGTRIRLKQANRRLEGAVLTAERLHAVLSLSGRPVPPLSNLRPVWKTCLVNQFHDILSGTLSDPAAEDAYRAYAAAEQEVAAFTDGLIPRDRDGLAAFNPSGWARCEVIELPGAGFVEAMVPALGTAEIPNTGHEPVPADAGTLENEFWTVTVGARGQITSCVCRRTGQQFVDPARPFWNDLVYRNDNGDLWLLDWSPLDGGSPASNLTETRSDDPYRTSLDPLVNDNPVTLARHARIQSREATCSPVHHRVTVEGTLGFWNNGCAFTTEVTLYAGDPLLHFRTRIAPRGRHWRLYACFPTPFGGGRIRHEVAFGAAQRDERRYATQNWCALEDSAHGTGVRLLNAGIPGNMVNDGVLSLLLFRSAAMEYKAPSSDAFEDGVAHEFSYAARPFTADDPGHAVREGETLNLPLRLVGAPITPPAPPFVLEPANVHLSALYELGRGEYLVRVYECAGRDAQTTLRLGRAGIAAAHVSDGVEGPGPEVPVAGDGSLWFRLRPWQIATWRARLA